MIKKLFHLLNPKVQKLFLEYKVELQPRYGHGKPPHRELYEIINRNREHYAGLLKRTLKYQETLLQIKTADKETNPLKPTWNNGFLPGLDIITLYMMVSEMKPARYAEIGSGNSTQIAYKAKTENNLRTEIISIDPAPRAEIDKLADKIIRQPFEKTDYAFLFDLSENDILFVDNSHRILPNSDSMVFFMEILPGLNKGVIVHLHDVYLPYDYPQFMCDRFYSEQYGLAAFLMANPDKYVPLLPNYFISEDKELSGILAAFWENPQLAGVEKHGGSFWLRISQ